MFFFDGAVESEFFFIGKFDCFLEELTENKFSVLFFLTRGSHGDLHTLFLDDIDCEDNSRDGNVFLEVGFDLAANSLVTLDV